MNIQKIRQILEEKKLNGFIFSDLKNIRYLSGYTGSNGLIYIDADKAIFFTDFRYKTQAAQQIYKGFQVEIADRGLLACLNKSVRITGKIGFESANVSHFKYKKFQEILPDVEFQAEINTVENLRQIKTQDEIQRIRDAIKITEKALNEVKHLIKPGMGERQFAIELIYKAWTLGAEDPSFDPIIASGVNGSKPHAGASAKEMQKGEFVTIDYGFYYKGYASDITRTFMIGQPDEKQIEVYNTVLKAQLAAEKVLKPEAKQSDVDKVARDIIKDAGFGDYFGHSLGHAIGLDVHDPGALAETSLGIVKEGMVFTNEPGIYIPDWGGVRIEDDILVTKDGCENLVTLPKTLEEMIV